MAVSIFVQVEAEGYNILWNNGVQSIVKPTLQISKT